MLNLTEALRSLTPKAHTDSTRFNKKKIVEICANLWLFVADKKTPILSIKSYFHLLKKSVSMDFKLDKIGVYFYNSRGASVGFNTSRAIPWDL